MVSAIGTKTQNGHSGILKFLSKAFLYPDQTVLGQLEKQLQSLRQNEFLKQIQTHFEKEPLVELQAEYTRLFINGYPKTCCPPYESVYREGQIMGNANQAVSDTYRNWGFSVRPVLADHIATELEFLAFLRTALEIPEISETAGEEYARFLADHVNRWFPPFLADLKNGAALEAYKLLADCLEDLLKESKT